MPGLWRHSSRSLCTGEPALYFVVVEFASSSSRVGLEGGGGGKADRPDAKHTPRQVRLDPGKRNPSGGTLKKDLPTEERGVFQGPFH